MRKGGRIILQITKEVILPEYDVDKGFGQRKNIQGIGWHYI